jgi:DNA-binding LacI/PurR family transcriptional regulator
MPQLVKLSEKLRGRGLDFVTLSTDESENEAAAFKMLMENSVAAPFFLKKVSDDDKFYNLVDPKWSGEMPAMFIYDRSSKRVRSFLGETPVKDIEAAIQKLL